jgi:putative ABC transport system substrate-binding protein
MTLSATSVVRHRAVRIASVLCGMLLAAALARPVAAEPAYASWFRLANPVLENWMVSEVSTDPNQVIVTPRYASPTESRKRIFVLYPSASTAYDIAISTILHVFAERRLNAEFTAFTFGGKNDAGKEALRLAEGGYSMIIAMGSSSTAWLWENYRGKRLPVVTVCSKDPVVLGQMPGYDHGSGTNFAFTSLNTPVEVQLGYILELKPSLKNLAVLVDAKNVSAVETQAKPIARDAQARGINVLDVGIDGPARAKEELNTKVQQALAKMRETDPKLEQSAFWVTGSTAVFKELQTINTVAHTVPVLSVVPELVKAGSDSAVLSIGVSFESNAQVAAVYAEKVLAGKAKVSDLKVGVVSPPDIAVNMQKARQIGLAIPFSWFESASYVYDYEGRPVRTSSRLLASDS